MKRPTSMFLLAGVLGLLATDAAQAAMITYNADGQPIAIQRLAVSGVGVFNVTIQYDLTFDDIFGSAAPNTTPFFTNTSTADAREATLAIMSALNDDGPVVPSITITEIHVPVDATSTNFYDAFDTDFNNSTGMYRAPANTPDFHVRDDSSFHIGFATFTVVPEPSSIVLAGIGLLCTLGYHRLRKRA